MEVKSLVYMFIVLLVKHDIITNQQAVPGLPMAMIFDKKTSPETRDIVNKAIKLINNNVKYGRNKWSIEIENLEMKNTRDLINSICNQMSRGALAYFSTTSLATLNTIRSFSNTYNLPLITWSNFPKSYYSDKEITNQTAKFKREIFVWDNLSKRSKRQIDDTDSDLDSDYPDENSLDNEVSNKKTSIIDLTQTVDDQPNQIYLRPDLSPALIELIKFYNWPEIYYIYNNDNGLINLDALVAYQIKNPNFIQSILIRRLFNMKNCRDMLRSIEFTLTNPSDDLPTKKLKDVVMIVDMDSNNNYKYFFELVKDLGMTKYNYHYVLSTLGINELNLDDFVHGGLRITGFSLIDLYNMNTFKMISEITETTNPINKIETIPHESALIIDGLIYLTKKINLVIGTNMTRLFGNENISLRRSEIYVNKNKGTKCTFDLSNSSKWLVGSLVLKQLKSPMAYEGLTGQLSFDANGKRNKYKIDVYRVELNTKLTKIGYYSSEIGLQINLTNNKNYIVPKKLSRDRTIIVTSVRDEPFFMFRENEEGKNWTGNDRFEGYCVDLTKRIAEVLNFSYELKLVKDNKFGAKDSDGVWNGMVGELVRNEADMAVASLTISTQRERAVAFSLPFMNIGISIMIKKPQKQKPGVFSFMSPLDMSIWGCILLAYLGVSTILFLIARFSPFEWQEKDGEFTNDFHMLNSLWSNLSAIMSQGVDFSPRSVSTRLVVGAWWFFTLIIISSYTANLAAFLTVVQIVNPINSAEDLIKQSEIQYGSVEGGSTKEFFRNSKVPTYSRMWSFMSSWGSNVFVNNNHQGREKVLKSKGKYAFLLESSVNEYLNERKPCDTIKVGENLDSKGYGIATPIGSELYGPINLALLQLREEGFLDQLKSKWWYEKSECTSDEPEEDPETKSLNLINVAGVFYILIVGLILSLIVGLLELLYSARLDAIKNNISFNEAVKEKLRLSFNIKSDDNKSKTSLKNSTESIDKNIEEIADVTKINQTLSI